MEIASAEVWFSATALRLVAVAVAATRAIIDDFIFFFEAELFFIINFCSASLEYITSDFSL